MQCPECNGELELWEIHGFFASGPQSKQGHKCPACDIKLFEYTSPTGEPVLLNISKRDPNEPLGEWIANELLRRQLN